MGSCDLHVVHGFFKSACEKTDWDIKGLLKSCFQLLKDSPARREAACLSLACQTILYSFVRPGRVVYDEW